MKRRPKPILTPEEQEAADRLKALKKHEREINRRLKKLVPIVNEILEKKK